MAVLENDTIDNWDLGSTSEESEEKFFNIMSKYIPKAKYKNLKNDTRKGFILPDGTSIVALWLNIPNCKANEADSYCGDFYMKVGSEPYYKPGTEDWNTNIFKFILNPNRIYPAGTKDSDFKWWCGEGVNYSFCTGWVIINENMDYLHCKGLSLNGKTRCN